MAAKVTRIDQEASGSSAQLYPVQLTALDFERFPRVLRRYSPANLLYLARQPRRRRRLLEQGQALVACWPKSPAAMKSWSGPVLAIGPLSDGNGLSRAARYEVDRLKSQCRELHTLDVRQVTAESVRQRIAAGDLPRPEVLVVLAQPDNYRLIFPLFDPEFLASAWRIGLIVWEMPYCPPEWLFLRGLLHEVWSPSMFSTAPIGKGLGLPFEVRPHHVVPLAGVPLPRARFGIAENAFLGLAIMDLRICPARKNPLAHVEAWQRAFGWDPERQLLIKASFPKRTEIVRRELVEMIGTSPNIRLVEDRFSDGEMFSFQRMADVYLSLHRSEGFGLNIKEMLEIGVPVVATDWSAPSEYLEDYANGIPVPARLIHYADFTGAYQTDFDLFWADADVEEAALALRRVASSWRPQVASR